MKKLIWILILYSSVCFSQTNYKTIMNQRDSINQKIDLHLVRAKRLDRVSNCMHLVAAVTMSSLYFLSDDLDKTIIIPAGIGVLSFFPQYMSWVQERKAEDLKQNYFQDYNKD